MASIGMTERELVQFAQDCHGESSAALEDLVARYDLNWALYDNDSGKLFPRKKSWQSRLCMPTISQSVESATTSMTRSMRGHDFYRYVVPDQENRWLEECLAEWARYWLERAGFLDAFEEGAKGAMLMGRFSAKARWMQDLLSDQAEMAVERALGGEGLGDVSLVDSRLELRFLDPRATFIDPYGNGMYVVEEYEEDLHVLEQQARDPNSRIRPEIIEKVAGDRATGNEDRRRMQAGDYKRQAMSNRRRLTVWEVYATLVDRRGRLVHDRVHYTVVGERYLLRYPQAIRLRSAKFPVVDCNIIRKPFSVKGKALVDDSAGMSLAVSEMFNAVIDAAKFAAVKAWAAKTMYLRDVGQLREGVAPGMVLELEHNCPPNEQPVWSLDTGRVPSDVLPIIQIMRGEVQSGTGVTDTVRGMPSSFGGRQTLGEVQQDLGQAVDMLNQIARNWEVRGGEPLLRLAMELVIRHQPEELQNSILADAGVNQEAQTWVAAMGRRELLDLYLGHVRVECAGVSGGLKLRQQLENIGAMLQMANGSPMANYIRYRKVLVEVCRVMGWKPDEYVMTDEELQAELMAQAGGAGGPVAVGEDGQPALSSAGGSM